MPSHAVQQIVGAGVVVLACATDTRLAAQGRMCFDFGTQLIDQDGLLDSPAVRVTCMSPQDATKACTQSVYRQAGQGRRTPARGFSETLTRQ